MIKLSGQLVEPHLMFCLRVFGLGKVFMIVKFLLDVLFHFQVAQLDFLDLYVKLHPRQIQFSFLHPGLNECLNFINSTIWNQGFSYFF
jgi:hypothetical protein